MSKDSLPNPPPAALDETMAYVDTANGTAPAEPVVAQTVVRPAPGAGTTRTPQAPAAGTTVGGQSAGSGLQQRAATVLGEYKLLKKLGQGGMGAVYQARHAGQDRVVAVKVLSKELAAKPAFVQRFLREARVMAQLDHPNVLRCFEVGEAKGYHYLAIEYVDGGSVEDQLKRLGRFALGDALHVILACARGLHHAHELGMVHRDVKPDNVLLTKDGQVKVADLGLAKQLDEDLDLTRTGTGAGTPLYMAPEQARDVKHIDRRCDIYALGCMLYAFLVGHPPFRGATLIELIEAKEKGRFTPMRKSNDEVPERLDLLVDKMVATRPEQRFASCAEIIAELEALGLANERLSFLDGAAPAAAPSASAPTSVPLPARATQQPVGRHTPPPPGSQTAVADYWFLRLTVKGQEVTRKLTAEQIRTMIRADAIDAQTPISRDYKGGFRPLGTVAEFQGLLRGQSVKEKVERKGHKTKDLYRELEEADARRRRWKWLNDLLGSAGRTAFGLLWIAFALGLLGAAGYFGYVYLIK